MISSHSIDELILKRLERGTQTVSDVAASIDVHRNSVGYRLEHLRRRGVVERQRNSEGKGNVWSLAYRSRKSRSQIQVFTGREYVRAYAALLVLPRESSLYVIQGKQSVRDAVRFLPKQLILKLRETYKRKHIVLKSIINKEFYSVLGNISTTILESHLDNTFGTLNVETKDFLGGADLAVSRTFVLVTHIRKQRAVLIKDREMVLLFYQVMELLFNTLEKTEHAYSVDASSLYKQVLNQRNAL